MNILKRLHQIKLNHLLIVFIAIVIGGIAAFGFKYYLLYESLSKVKGITTEAVSQTPIPTDIQPTNTISEDADPIVSCQSPNCGSIDIRNSQCTGSNGYICCQVGNKWSWYSSRDKCYSDRGGNTYQPTQNSQNQNTNTITTQTSQTEPNITCVLSWGTYQLPKSTCDQYKNSPTIDTSAPKTVPIYTQPTIVPVDHSKLQQDCINAEIKSYNDMLFEYQRQWGHAPTDDFMAKQHNINLANCNKL